LSWTNSVGRLSAAKVAALKVSMNQPRASPKVFGSMIVTWGRVVGDVLKGLG
jgi:hypothetical protein